MKERTTYCSPGLTRETLEEVTDTEDLRRQIFATATYRSKMKDINKKEKNKKEYKRYKKHPSVDNANLKESNHPENEAKDERGGRSGGKNHNRVSSQYKGCWNR